MMNPGKICSTSLKSTIADTKHDTGTKDDLGSWTSMKDAVKHKRNRPGNLNYSKIPNMLRINIIYSREVLKMKFRDISVEFGVNYNSVRNILKVHKDGELLNNSSLTPVSHG